MKHNGYIVVTSIHPPTTAIISYSRMFSYTVIVVGDRKTPTNYFCPNVIFLEVHDSRIQFTKLYKVLPYNHYSRKMLGYLYAIKHGADLIVDTDDDNIPKPTWSIPSFHSAYRFLKANTGFVNIYNYFSEQHIWPRGYPLRLILRNYAFANTEKQVVDVGVWQGLADGDPDVDAIYRLTSNSPCYFKDVEPIVLGKNTICPFNSQNTVFRQELFPLLYLPTTVSFRFTDILRGLVAQPLMWLYDYYLGFHHATVIQERNEHNFFDDFVSELSMYQCSEEVLNIITPYISKTESLTDNLHTAYDRLRKVNIVKDSEMESLNAWLYDIE